jgi:hypothetical protein
MKKRLQGSSCSWADLRLRLRALPLVLLLLTSFNVSSLGLVVVKIPRFSGHSSFHQGAS